MNIPAIVGVSAASQLLIPLAALRSWSALPPTRRWIAVWGAVLVIWAGIQTPLAARGVNNLWVPYLTSPFEVGALLIALSGWHPEAGRRRLFFWAAGIFALVEAILLVSFERLDQFSLFVGPFKALLLLVAGVLTLLACLRRHEGDLLREEWFWICLGVSLKYGSSAALDPLSWMLLGTYPAAVIVAFQAVAWINTFASLVIARGLLCPILPRPSSGPSSPDSWRSSSSSPHSALPS